MIVCVPGPARNGLNILNMTPGPLKVPPGGVPFNGIVGPARNWLGYVPALTTGSGMAVTVTVAVALTIHGAVANTVYVYTPAPAGAGLHVPPRLGAPPSCVNNCAAVTVLPAQIDKRPFVPALGCAWAVTVTVAVADGHGVAVTV